MVEVVLEKTLHGIVIVDVVQFGFMPDRGAIDVVFILRRLQEKYPAKGKKLYLFCGPRKSF